MKVILRDDIVNVGRQGEIKVVAPGFARNYLLPRKLAMQATPQNLKVWEKEKGKLEKIREKVITDAKVIAEQIEKLSIVIPVKVGENNKLFGSVTNANVAKAVVDAGVNVDKHHILLAQPIKVTGEYTLDVRLHPEVVAKLKVAIVEEKSRLTVEEEAAPAAETPAEAPAAPEAPAAEETKEEAK